MEATSERSRATHRVEALFAEAEQTLCDADPERILAWAGERFGERAGISCSFGGPGGVVLAHMAAQVAPRCRILFIDTGFLFPETYELLQTLQERLGLNIVIGKPALTPAHQEALHGPRLWERDPDLCCHLRKVEPMVRLLTEVDCWVTALRRDQSPTRSKNRRFELHRVGPDHVVLKVNPLADWSRADVWRYIHRHDLPYNRLLDDGYSSLGCIHCTARSNGPDERAGRWQGKPKTECGLHTFTQPAG